VAKDNDGDSDGSGSSGALRGSSGNPGGFTAGVSAQLQSAITSALGASGSSDPNQIIQSAIKQFLAGGSKQPAAGADSDGDTDGSNTSNSSTANSDATDSTAQQATFSQSLSSNGIDGKQFQRDLQTALQSSSSNGGSVNFSKLFQNFPPGSTLDVQA
jgi:hypothetical protein